MSNNWWAQKLGAPAPAVAPARPVYTPAATPAPQPSAAPVQARSARREDYCPECQSTNYMQPTPNAGFRCFDCGYPVVQSGSGISSVKSEGPVRAARQPAGLDSKFNPGVIIGRIE